MIYFIFYFFLILIISEVILQGVVRYLHKDFQWLITEKDEYPRFDKKALKKFFKNSFDQELGWVRKPNSKGIENGIHGNIEFHIDANGSRKNTIKKSVSVVSFGDSYTFCRQVEDNQTWQVFLSKKLNRKVLNFGVGNYGIDQALLYYKRQSLPPSTKIVILGFVPETICRIQSYWKHYLEFGNTFAFKPRYTLNNNNLVLHNNPIKKINDFDSIVEIIESIKNTDRFYKTKFRHVQFRFPYLIKFFVNFKRNVILLFLLIKKLIFNIFKASNTTIDNDPFSKIMIDNIKDAHSMYQDEDALELLEAILLEFRDEAYKRGHQPLVLVMPQLIDLKIIDKLGINPYEKFFDQLNKKIPVLDITKYMDKKVIGNLYAEDVYGGHFSVYGNELVADKLQDYLIKMGEHEKNIS